MGEDHSARTAAGTFSAFTLICMTQRTTHCSPARSLISSLAEILATMASDLLSQVLNAVSQADGPILSNDVFPTIDFTTIKSVLDRLGSREMIIYKQIDREEAHLTPEATEIAAQGSHEAKVFEAVRQAVDGLKIADLPVRSANCTPARLDHKQSRIDQLTQRRRVSLVKRAPRSAREKHSRKDGSRKTKTC